MLRWKTVHKRPISDQKQQSEQAVFSEAHFSRDEEDAPAFLFRPPWKNRDN